MMDSYDEIPYESTPFPETHPEFLATTARLFGVAAADPAACRVLEIGCASGGNLIPMACQLPGSRFLGIELSARQAGDGARTVAQLGLGNIEIRQGDLLAFPAEAGEFDYIIAHGLYSWVPQAVREKLLEVCRNHLSDNGIAYISYNTLPGWRWRGMLRDMLLYHTREASGPADKLRQAQAFLAQMAPALNGLDSLTSGYLREELKRIANRPPSYLFHEYLEATNQAFLFSDFIADSRRHGLEYLADADLAGMFPFSLGEAAADLLEQHEDMVEMWQYMDFLSGRTFRQSLLCRKGSPLDYDIDLDAFTRLAFAADLQPQKRPDLRRRRSARFHKPDGGLLEVQHPLTQAALLHLGEHYPDAIGFEELRDAAREALLQAGNQTAANETGELQHELFGLFTRQEVVARTSPIRFVRRVGERPRANRLARQQAAEGLGQIAVAHHGSLQLDPFSSRLLLRLDGRNSRQELEQQMSTAMLQEPELKVLLGEAQLRDPARLRHSVAANCQRLLQLFARNGVLEA
jgi:methyltransferase-like protein